MQSTRGSIESTGGFPAFRAFARGTAARRLPHAAPPGRPRAGRLLTALSR
jgi:hypothetical protein